MFGNCTLVTYPHGCLNGSILQDCTGSGVRYIGAIPSSNSRDHVDSRVKACRRTFYALQGIGLHQADFSPNTTARSHMEKSSTTNPRLWGPCSVCLWQNYLSYGWTARLQANIAPLKHLFVSQNICTKCTTWIYSDPTWRMMPKFAVFIAIYLLNANNTDQSLLCQQLPLKVSGRSEVCKYYNHIYSMTKKIKNLTYKYKFIDRN